MAANIRLFQFPAKASPTPSDIIYGGDAASSFNEVQMTIAQLIGAYPTLLGLGGVSLGANNYIYTDNLSAYVAGTISALAVSLLAGSTPTAMQTTLGLLIGTNVEAWSAALDSIAGLTTAADEMIYTTALDVYATTPLTVVARTMLSQTTNALILSTIGALPTAGGTMTGQIDMASHKIINLLDPTNPQDAATKAYVDGGSGVFLPLAGGTMSGVIDMGNHKITHLTDPTSAQDAATKFYIDNALTNYLALAGGTMGGNIVMAGHAITSLLDPVNSQDAATKAYVDSVATGLTVQGACYAATTGSDLGATYSNGALGIGATLTNAGALVAFSVDSVSPPINSRILVKDQSSTFQNGIYTLTTVGSGAVAWILTRATDYDQPSEIQPGDLVIINNGTVNAGTSWLETATISAVGTDAILFSQFTFAASAVLLKAQNLNDVASKTTSFDNISPLSTKGDLIVYTSTNTRLAVGGTDGQFLQVLASAASGLAWSTLTLPATGTANQLLYISATNVASGLASANGGVLVTSNAGVPSILVGSGTTGTPLLATASGTPSWGSFALALGGALTSAGAVTFSGAHTFTATLTGNTNVTFPTSGTLSTSSGTVSSVATSGLASGGTITTTGTITVTAAVKSDQTTSTSTSVAVVPGVQQYHPSATKAWAQWAGASGTIASSYNVSSVTHNSTGNFTVNFTVSFADTNYCASGSHSASGGSTSSFAIGTTFNVGSAQCRTFANGAAVDATLTCATFSGNQ